MSGSYGGVRRDDYVRRPHDREYEGAERSGHRGRNDEGELGQSDHGHRQQTVPGPGSRDDMARSRTGFMGGRDYAWSEVGARTGTQMDHRGKGPRGYRRSDDRIREDVSDRLSDDPVVDASNIEVSVAQGEVTLTGFVESRQAKRRAEDVVETVRGVTDVQNNLRIERSEDRGR